MRPQTLLFTGIFLLGCPSTPPEKPKPVPPAPATTLSPSTSQGAALSPTTKASPDLSLAKGILAGEVVAYSDTQHAAVFAETYEQEGTGAGLTLIFLVKDATERQEQELYTPSDDAEAKQRQELPALAARLEREGYAALNRTAWPEGQASLPLPLGLTLSWKANVLSAAQDGEATNTRKHPIKPEKPFTVRPIDVYHIDTLPWVLVKLSHDPGSKYAEGFNAFSSYEVIGRPPVLRK